jgi:hypothetical protein
MKTTGYFGQTDEKAESLGTNVEEERHVTDNNQPSILGRGYAKHSTQA